MSVNCRICDKPSAEGNNLEILNLGFIKQRFPLFLSRGLPFSAEDNVCGECFQIVDQVSDLIKQVEGTEKKIEAFLETLSGKFPTGGNVQIFPIDDADIKPEPEDWNDVDLNDFELVDKSDEEKPIDIISPKRETRRHRKRKLHFDQQVAAPIVPEKTKRTNQSKESKKRKKEFIVIVRNENNEAFVFDVLGPPKPNAYDENSPNQEVRVNVENLAELLPPNIKDNLKSCKFIVKQNIKEEKGTVGKKRGRPRKDNFQKNVPKKEILDDEEEMDLDLETNDKDEDFSPEIKKSEFEDQGSDSDYSETFNKARKIKSRKRQKKENKKLTPKVENVEPLKRKRNRTKRKKEETQSPRNIESMSIREIFEPDPTKIADLTEVNGKKYYLNYAFEQVDNEMTCGFPICQFKLTGESDTILNFKMMKHIWNAHFPKKPEYKDSIASHRCDICQELPPMKIVEFRRHYKSFHPSFFSSDNPKFNDVVCRFCAKPFVEFAAMKIHEWSHYSEAELKALAAQGFPRPQHSYKNIPSGTRFFRCQHCPKQFSTRQGFLQHQIISHTDPKDRPRYLCSICGKECLSERGMTMHNMRFHDQDKFLGRYKTCTICDKRFILKPQLDNHMVRHHGRERPIVCEICGWKFTSKSDLNKHLSSHKPKEWRPFSCKLCSEAYRYKSNLTRHIEKVHGVEHLPPKPLQYPFIPQPKLIYQGCKQMYPCPICEKVFELPSRMKKHCRTHRKDQIVDTPTKITQKQNTNYEEDQEFMPDEAEIAVEYILT